MLVLAGCGFSCTEELVQSFLDDARLPDQKLQFVKEILDKEELKRNSFELAEDISKKNPPKNHKKASFYQDNPDYLIFSSPEFEQINQPLIKDKICAFLEELSKKPLKKIDYKQTWCENLLNNETYVCNFMIGKRNYAIQYVNEHEKKGHKHRSGNKDKVVPNLPLMKAIFINPARGDDGVVRFKQSEICPAELAIVKFVPVLTPLQQALEDEKIGKDLGFFVFFVEIAKIIHENRCCRSFYKTGGYFSSISYQEKAKYFSDALQFINKISAIIESFCNNLLTYSPDDFARFIDAIKEIRKIVVLCDYLKAQKFIDSFLPILTEKAPGQNKQLELDKIKLKVEGQLFGYYFQKGIFNSGSYENGVESSMLDEFLTLTIKTSRSRGIEDCDVYLIDGDKDLLITREILEKVIKNLLIIKINKTDDFPYLPPTCKRSELPIYTKSGAGFQLRCLFGEEIQASENLIKLKEIIEYTKPKLESAEEEQKEAVLAEYRQQITDLVMESIQVETTE